MSNSVRVIGWYALAGVFLGTPFVLPTLWLTGVLGVVAFLYATSLAKVPREVLWGGFAAWTIKSLIALAWGWSIWPLDWFFFSLPLAGFWAIALYWICGAVFLGVGGAFAAGWLWYFLVHKKFEALALLALPFLWLIGEVMAAQIFSVMTIGPNGFYTAAFSYGQLGYILAEHKLLILIAKFGGLYLLTIVAVLIGVALWYSYRNIASPKRLVLGVGMLATLIISGFVEVPFGEATPADYKIAVVDTKFNNQIIRSSDEIIEREELLGEAIEAALANNVTHIILPEGSRFSDANQSADTLARRLRFQTSDAEVILIDSGRAKLTPTDTALRATIYDGVSKQAWQVDKQYLVPQGEYVPMYFGKLFQLLGMGGRVSELQQVFDFVPGPLASQNELPSDVPRILFCFSSADPLAVRRLLTNAEVPFVVHPISHAWFGDSQILKDQQKAMLKIQSLWNGVAIVSAGNMVRGELYTKEGQVLEPVLVAKGEGWTVSVIGL